MPPARPDTHPQIPCRGESGSQPRVQGQAGTHRGRPGLGNAPGTNPRPKIPEFLGFTQHCPPGWDTPTAPQPRRVWGKADPRPHKSRSPTSSKCSWGGLEQQTHPSYLRKGLRGSRLRGWIRGWIPALAPPDLGLEMPDLGLELPDLGLTPQDLGLSAPAPGAEITSQEMRERGTETLISISLQSWGQRGRSPRKAPGDRGRDRGRDRGGAHPPEPQKPGVRLPGDPQDGFWEWGELPAEADPGKTSWIF